jgi:hypothetical protein
MEILDGAFGSRPLREVFGYDEGWEIPSHEDAALVRLAMGGAGDHGEPEVYAEP